MSACRTPRKHRYADEATARAQAARHMEIDAGGKRHGKKFKGRQAPYKCPDCGFWHLTTVEAEGRRPA